MTMNVRVTPLQLFAVTLLTLLALAAGILTADFAGSLSVRSSPPRSPAQSRPGGMNMTGMNGMTMGQGKQ